MKTEERALSPLASLRRRLQWKRAKVTAYLDDSFYSSCVRILQEVMAMDKNRIFLCNPVLHLQGYQSVIPHPMFWQEIERKLRTYRYSSAAEFIADMRLVFDNCYTFNTLKSPISECAREAEVHMETLFVKVLGEPPSRAAEIMSIGKEQDKEKLRGASSEIYKIIRFYEMKNKTGEVMSGGKITPAKYSCACQRRILEALKQCKVQKSNAPLKERHIPKSSVRKASTEVPDDLLKLDAVPQNTRFDNTAPVLSPVVAGEDPLSEEEDVRFAEY